MNGRILTMPAAIMLTAVITFICLIGIAEAQPQGPEKLMIGGSAEYQRKVREFNRLNAQQTELKAHISALTTFLDEILNFQSSVAQITPPPSWKTLAEIKSESEALATLQGDQKMNRFWDLHGAATNSIQSFLDSVWNRFRGLEDLVSTRGGDRNRVVTAISDPQVVRRVSALNAEIGSTLKQIDVKWNCGRFGSSTIATMAQAKLTEALEECFNKNQGFLKDGVDEVKTKLEGVLGNARNEISAEIQAEEAKLKAIIPQRDQLEIDLASSTELDQKIFITAAIGFGVIMIAFIGVPILYKENVQILIFSNNMVLEVLTVFLLITTIMILGIAQRISEDSLGTLLGGISGYVLGRSVAGATGNRSGGQGGKNGSPAQASTPQSGSRTGARKGKSVNTA
jgi:ElaB/YqjD/DUF883 family membrane-anchored ribosome-binding protein|tara:strand:+ start:317 stop:1510 length:1194 start_codon:yes stop_codon:yes gene_type:complete